MCRQAVKAPVRLHQRAGQAAKAPVRLHPHARQAADAGAWRAAEPRLMELVWDFVWGGGHIGNCTIMFFPFSMTLVDLDQEDS
mmetsp:Transcript_5064/g.13733  ORF Transcript_5064/g.13733 Transcript_5064/m.13733 type:complete len:83 (+) Transcript_5064:41-289(+)|eukprot:658381-Pelagomonas_calceolata.AAC.3